MALPAAGYFTDPARTNSEAKTGQDTMLESVRTALQSSSNLSDVDDAATALENLGAEPADADILKSDTPDLLQAVYGDEAQTHTGTDLSGLTVNRNHISWTLTASSQFSDATLPYDGTYIFHVYPAGNTLALAASYKTDGTLPAPDSAAGEVRLVVELYNNRKTIVGLQNMEA